VKLTGVSWWQLRAVCGGFRYPLVETATTLNRTLNTHQ
jgi:hypothetical protein